MKIYLKNENTNEIIVLQAESYEALSDNFRRAPYVRASDDETESCEAEKLKEKLILSRKTYLESTDWEIVKAIELGVDAPADVVTERALARQEINEIELIDNLEDLQNYNENF